MYREVNKLQRIKIIIVCRLLFPEAIIKEDTTEPGQTTNKATYNNTMGPFCYNVGHVQNVIFHSKQN